MAEKLRFFLFALLLNVLFGTVAKANTQKAASCNASDVQTAVNSAAEGDTVTIPAGTCSWTSGVAISGKGIYVRGAGSGRIVAYSLNTLALKTGSISITVSPSNVAGTMPSFTVGQTLRVIELGFLANFLQGTVASYNSTTGALSMTITSAGGTCGTTNGATSNCKRWMISTAPSVSETVLVNNTASGNAMFNINEDTTVHTTVSGIHFAQSSPSGAAGAAAHIVINRNGPGGQAVLVHDNWFENANPEQIDTNSNRGVVWNNTFTGSPYTAVGSGIRVRDSAGNLAYSWTTRSTMGTADTNGQQNFYIETNDFEAVGQVSDFAGNSRTVVRSNFLNNAFGSSHGADTEPYGLRHIEFYSNKLIYQSYGSDASAINPGFGGWLIRGGSFVFYNNDVPSLTSSAWGTKADITLQVENLNRSSGPNPCWGINTTGSARYHSPRQTGTGNVTGTGTDGLGRKTDTVTYVGDSEPIYIWGNTRSGTASALSLSVESYPSGQGDSCSGVPDSPDNYFALNRDYFNGTTAKPGWAPYTYPHPLTGSQSSGTTAAPAAPTSLSATVN